MVQDKPCTLMVYDLEQLGVDLYEVRLQYRIAGGCMGDHRDALAGIPAWSANAQGVVSVPPHGDYLARFSCRVVQLMLQPNVRDPTAFAQRCTQHVMELVGPSDTQVNVIATLPLAMYQHLPLEARTITFISLKENLLYVSLTY